MPRYRVTMVLQQGVFGISETLYTNVVTATGLTTRLNTLMTLRNNLLFTSTNWVGIRYSVAPNPAGAPADRRSVFYPPGTFTTIEGGAPLNVPAQGLIIPANKQQGSDQARACLQTRVTYDTDRRAVRYMGFVPDAILGGEPASYNIGQDPAWDTKFEAYKLELKNGNWAIKARDKSGAFAAVKITNWVQSASAPTNLGVVLPAAPPFGATVGEMIQVQGVRRKGTDKLSYNGRYFIDAINTTLLPGYVIYYLRGTEIGDPASIKLPGNIQRVGYAYFTIEAFSGIKAGVHKRGKPQGTPLGRRKTRVSLDP